MKSLIHHTQHKLAAKIGGTLEASNNNEGVVIGTLDGIVYTAVGAKATLDQMIAYVKKTDPARLSNSSVKLINVGKDHFAVEGLPKTPKAAKPRKAKKAKKPRKSDEDEDGEGDDEDGGKGSVVKPLYKKKYQPHKGTCGDDFIDVLRAATVDDDDNVDVQKLAKVATANGLTIKPWLHLRSRSGGVNVGMIRMNLGNKLRALVRRGTDIDVGGKVIKGDKIEKKTKAPRKSKKEE